MIESLLTTSTDRIFFVFLSVMAITIGITAIIVAIGLLIEWIRDTRIDKR